MLAEEKSTIVTAENKAMVAKLSTLQETPIKVEDCWADGEITREIYEKRSGKLKLEIKEVVVEFGRSQISISNPTGLIEKRVKFAADISNLWLSGDYEERKMVQEILFPEGIIYDKENDSFRTSNVNYISRLYKKNRRQINNTFDLSPSVARGS
jgi:site-specific DNA recombinase